METRNKIIKGATSLFIENGIKAVTMDDIASNLGISKRTIYENFVDKTDLLKVVLTYHIEEKQKSTFNQTEGKSVVETLRFLLQHIDKIADNYKDFRFVQELKKYYPELHKEIIDEYVKEGIEKLSKFIEQGQVEGIFLEAVSPEIASFMLQEQVQQFSQPEKFPSRVEALVLFKHIIITFFRGLGTEKGIKDIDTMIQEYNGKGVA
jgi:AcrR family transcriptional regulator